MQAAVLRHEPKTKDCGNNTGSPAHATVLSSRQTHQHSEVQQASGSLLSKPMAGTARHENCTNAVNTKADLQRRTHTAQGTAPGLCMSPCAQGTKRTQEFSPPEHLVPQPAHSIPGPNSTQQHIIRSNKRALCDTLCAPNSQHAAPVKEE